MKEFKLITIGIFASLLSGCFVLEMPCYNTTSSIEKNTVYKKMVSGVYLKKSYNDKYISIEINPSEYRLFGKTIDGKFLNAKLTLINNSNQKITSNCNSLTYKAYSDEDGSPSGILPSFQCNDNKLVATLDSFIQNSTFIQGKLTFGILANIKSHMYALKEIPLLQRNNVFSFNFENKTILNYTHNGLNRGSEGGSCWNSKPYSEILSSWGNIFSHRLIYTDTRNKSTSNKIPESDLRLCMKKYGARNTSPNNYKQIEKNYMAKSLCKKELSL